MTTTLVAPTVADYEASADLATLLVRTTDGDALSVPAGKLRLSCKCAHCTRARFDDRFPERVSGHCDHRDRRPRLWAEHLVFGWA